MAVAFDPEKTYTIREARRDLNRIIERLNQEGTKSLALTQRNETKAVLVSADYFTELERRLAGLVP